MARMSKCGVREMRSGRGRHIPPHCLPPLLTRLRSATLSLVLGGALLWGGVALAVSGADGNPTEDGVPDRPPPESSARKQPAPTPDPSPAPAKPAPAPAKPAPPDAKPAELPSGFVKDFPIWGPREASVRIVIFSDFECPYCARTSEAITQVMKQYPNEVQIEFLNLPLPQHANARIAAIAGIAAHRQKAFWPMHDKLFNGDNDLDHKSFLRMAGELSLDVARFERDLKDPALAKLVERDLAIGKAVGADGTPTLFINGRGVFGAKPFKLLQVHIDAEIAAARQAGERGRAWLLKRARERNRNLVALVY